MLHQTALHATHEALGATLVDFGGWDMPLWYPTGAVKEHLAVIQHAGLFDIGHMAGLMVSGPDALEALQWAFTKDLSLSGPRAAYGAFLDASGGVVDDAIVYPLSEGRYFVVLNVGKGERIAESLSAWAASEGKSVTIRDLAGTYGKLDLQGPATVRVMTKLLKDPEAVFDKLPYFSFKGDIELANSDIFLADGTPIFLSRTGYTGEQGFEIFVPYDKIRGTQLDRHQRQRVSGKLFHIDLTADVQHAVFDEPGCAGTDSHFGEPQIRGDVSKRGAAITQRLDNCQIGFVELGFHDIPMGRGLAKAGIHSQNQYAFCKNFSFKKG